MSDRIAEWAERIPEALLLDFQANRPPIFFVGAGFGREAVPPLPTAADLEKDLQKELDLKDGGFGLAELLQFYRNKHNSDEYVLRWLKRKLLHDAEPAARPGGAHFLLLQLPGQLYLSTNYDLLLSDAARISLPRDRWKTAATHQEFEAVRHTYPEAKRCWNLHGSFEDGESDRLVATTKDYVQRYLDDTWKDAFRVFCGNRPIVFLGYSLRDFTTWTVFIEAIYRRPKHAPAHVLVTPTPSPHVSRFWEDHNTRHVALKAHQFLIALNNALGLMAADQTWVYAAAAVLHKHIDDAAAILNELKINDNYPSMRDAAYRVIKDNSA
jgi:hypothetical protein